MTSIFLAQIFSLYLLIMGLAMIVKRQWLREVLAAFFESKGTMFLATIITLILGIILVLMHPLFTWDWRLVITIICWLTLIKGLVYLFAPELIIRHKQQMLAKSWVWYLSGGISVLVGVYLGFCGFFGCLF